MSRAAEPKSSRGSRAQLPTKLLLAGYFGCGNLGDDAIMLGFIQSLNSATFDVTVLSGNAEETFRNYGVRSVMRKDLKAVKAAIDEHDCLVFPGGSIFQDVTSVRSVAYYSQLAKIAKGSGKKVAMLAQGVGPLNRFLGKRLAVQAFNSADILTVRDPASAAALKSLGVKKRVATTADMAFLLPRPADGPDQQNFMVSNMPTVGLSPRPHGKDREIVDLFGGLSRLLFEAKLIPVLIEMDRSEDGPLILEISKQQGGKIPDLRKMQSPMQLQQRLMRMDSLIAMRLHAGVLAATVGVAPLMVSYDPKVEAFAKLMGLGFAPSLKGLTSQRLFDRFMEFQKDRETNKKILDRQLAEMTKLARQNIELIEGAFRPADTM